MKKLKMFQTYLNWIWHVESTGYCNKDEWRASELKYLRVDTAILVEAKKNGEGSSTWEKYFHFNSGVHKKDRVKNCHTLKTQKMYKDVGTNKLETAKYWPNNARILSIYISIYNERKLHDGKQRQIFRITKWRNEKDSII